MTKEAQAEPAKVAFEDLQLIPLEVFAPRIGWHPESLRRACRQGRVKAVKVGRGWRIPRAVAAEIQRNGIPGK